MHFSPAVALWDNRETLTRALPEIRAVRETLELGIGGRRDFVQQQWLQLASVVVEFKPDLILELGRGYGNSLCAMALGLKMLRPRPARLVSLCIANSFIEISRPYLETHLDDPSLFAPVEALTKNIVDHDFSADLQRASRVLVFWDAHGYDLAIDLLARLFPMLSGKEHLAIVHDMADLNYVDSTFRRYDSGPLWQAMGSAPPKFILGNVGCQYEESIALADFLGRNGLKFHSAESSYFPELSQEQVEELKRRFGDDFSQFGFWYYFSLNEACGRDLNFPPTSRIGETVALGPLLISVPLARMETSNGGSATAGPDGVRLVTATPQWAYSLSGQVLQDQQPPDMPIVVRTRIRVLKGALGISISEKNDISKLIEEIFVHPSDEFRTVDLDIPMARNAGSLIFRNSSPSGASRAIIESVEVYQRP
jgi:hypothetical protein